jgi:hypothetical protein
MSLGSCCCDLVFVLLECLAPEIKQENLKLAENKVCVSYSVLYIKTGNFSNFVEKGTSKQVTFRILLRKVH